MALYDDSDARAPNRHQLKAWLLGGQSIATYHPLFDLAGFKRAIVCHLFGEDSYFAPPDLFWQSSRARAMPARLPIRTLADRRW